MHDGPCPLGSSNGTFAPFIGDTDTQSSSVGGGGEEDEEELRVIALEEATAKSMWCHFVQRTPLPIRVPNNKHIGQVVTAVVLTNSNTKLKCKFLETRD
jgi:hypothetical protein